MNEWGDLSTYPLRQIRIPLAEVMFSPVRVTAGPKRRWRALGKSNVAGVRPGSTQESALRRYETLGTLGQGGHSLADLGWPHHSYSTSHGCGKLAQDNAEYSACKEMGIKSSPRQGDFLAPPPPNSRPPVDGALAPGSPVFPPPPPSSASTPPPLTRSARCSSAGWDTRWTFSFAASSSHDSSSWRPRKKRPPPRKSSPLHSASASRSTGYCQPSQSPQRGWLKWRALTLPPTKFGLCKLPCR